MDIVCFGQQNWDVCWTGKQHLMSRLAARNHRVLYIDPKSRPGKKTFREKFHTVVPLSQYPGLRRVDQNLWVYTHYSFSFLPQRLHEVRYRRAVKTLMRKLGLFRPIGFFLIPEQRTLFDELPFFARIYYAIDEWTEFGGLTEQKRSDLRRNEEHMVRCSDLALAVSPRLFQRFGMLNPERHLLMGGVDTDHSGHGRIRVTEPDRDIKSIPKPRIGYTGYIDNRLDYSMLSRVAETHPDWHFVFVGRVQELVSKTEPFLRFVRKPNVHLLGQRPYELLPAFFAGFDICIAPYIISDLTQSCNPLKVYEYLATGLPTVVTPVEGLSEDVRSAILTPAGIDEWERALTAALQRPEQGLRQRLETAMANSWDARVDQLEEHFDAVLNRACPEQSPPRDQWWSTGRGAPRRLQFWKGEPPLDGKERVLQLMRASAGLRQVNPVLYQLTHALGAAGYSARVLTRLVGKKRPVVIRRILLSRRGTLGDAVLFLPTLHALRARFPDARIEVASGDRSPLMSMIVESSGSTDGTVRLYEERRSFKKRLRQALALLRSGYDLLVMGSFLVNAPTALYSGAPHRVGLYDGNLTALKLRRLLLFDPNRHESDNHLALAEALGAETTIENRIPSLRPERLQLEPELQQMGERFPMLLNRPYIVMHPGANRPSRQWPVERFAELTNRFLTEQEDVDVVLTGTGGETGIAGCIASGLDPALRDRLHNTSGQTSLNGLFALIQRAEAVVSNDTGTVHVARALDRPLLALFGPENDRRWGPYPVGRAPAIVLRHIVPCAPCARRSCPGHFCMRQLSTGEVHAALQQLMARAGGGLEDADPAPATEGGAGPAASDPAPANEAGAEPESHSPRRFGQLDRRRTHWSWNRLAASGYSIPSVQVVALLRDGSPDQLRESLKAFAAAVHGCPYPLLEPYVLTGRTPDPELSGIARAAGIGLLIAGGPGFAGRGRPAGSARRPGKPDPTSGIEHIVRTSDAPLIRFWSGEPLSDIPEHVAVLYRFPPVMGICGRDVLDLSHVADRIPWNLARCTVLRKALELMVVRRLSRKEAEGLVPLITDPDSEWEDFFSPDSGGAGVNDESDGIVLDEQLTG